MKKFIGAMIFGVVVVIYMVVQMNREQPTEELPSPNARAVDEAQWGEPQQAEMRPASDEPQDDVQSFESYQAQSADEEEVEVYFSEYNNGYVPPQLSSLAEVEAARDRNMTGRNTINLDLVPYQLEFEPVDYQWFREMEQALYRVSYDVLEHEGVRMVNLECATSVCIADFDVAPGAELSSNTFYQASQEIDTLSQEALSMVFMSGNNGVVERIIFQRKE